jgi:hypothetical protein
MISTKSVQASFATTLFAVYACVVGTAQNSFTPIRIKCAGPSYTDPQGQVWSADPGYAGGIPSSSTASISTTNLGPLYESSRLWNSAASPGRYNFTVPNGTYSVVLKFAETSVTQPGQRIFNVSINDQSVLTNFDIFASAGGANIALDKQYAVAVSSGQLEIQLAAVTGAAMMCAIQITATSAQSLYDVVAKIQPASGATSFSLPDIPIVGTLRVYRNGLLLSDGNDYFLSDNQLWFEPGQSPQVTDLIQVLFKH